MCRGRMQTVQMLPLSHGSEKKGVTFVFPQFFSRLSCLQFFPLWTNALGFGLVSKLLSDILLA